MGRPMIGGFDLGGGGGRGGRGGRGGMGGRRGGYNNSGFSVFGGGDARFQVRPMRSLCSWCCGQFACSAAWCRTPYCCWTLKGALQIPT